MTSQKDHCDYTEIKREKNEEQIEEKKDKKDVSLHKRRKGEDPAAISVKPNSSDTESTPYTAGLSPEGSWYAYDAETSQPAIFCENMIQQLKDKEDLASVRGKSLAVRTKNTLESLDQLEKVLELLDQFISIKERNEKVLKKLRDVNQLKRLHEAYKRINTENEALKYENKDLQLINEALDTEMDSEYTQVMLESILAGSRCMKRVGSKWKGHTKFGGSLLRKQRSRSAGGDESDLFAGSSLRRRSEGPLLKEVEKSKVSKWTKVKAAFRWEKAQWQPGNIAGAAGAVAAGAMIGAVALAGSNPSPTSSYPPLNPTSSSSDPVLATNPSASIIPCTENKDSASLTPGSALSLTPNSSCEELRIDSGSYRKSDVARCDGNENTHLHAPTHAQEDSSTSPSPNKLYKSPWGKMRDIIQTRRESVRKKSGRGAKNSPDVVPARRRSLSDGGDSDAPPVLTLTIPSSEELESEPSHPVLRKQRSLELGARPPLHRLPRTSKWTKVKRAFLTSASASVPSSPNRNSAFFTDGDTEALSSGCEANAVREEIARDYAVLQSRLRKEFSDRRASRPVATEEQLSADFRKKLTEWQRIKGVKQPPPIPARKDLSEDFLKRWDEWKRMKDTNSVPTWEEEAKPDEVLVQTSTGLFKFQGISRSFTRKLHEWEKSRGIAPEASTSALLRAAKARNASSAAPLTRTQSDGSVAPFASEPGRHHGSSLSVNDVDDLESEYERDHILRGIDECDGENARGAVIVEVEDEEVCTAAPLVAVSPRHTPQKPVYTYGEAEARLLCETSSAITGTAIVQTNHADNRIDCVTPKRGEVHIVMKKNDRQTFKRNVLRQPSIEEDAKLIRKSIEEVEKGSSRNFDEIKETTRYEEQCEENPSTSKVYNYTTIPQNKKRKEMKIVLEDICKLKDTDKINGKKKNKSRSRLEREQSKPSESDTEHDVDTVTVEIPKRRKRARRASEKPRTPPTSLHSESEDEVFILKLKTTQPRNVSPEVIVKTTRKIFSPVVLSGKSVPTAVIPVDVEDLPDVKLTQNNISNNCKHKGNNKSEYKSIRSKSSGDLNNAAESRPRNRPPLPSSPSTLRKIQPKETSPSIRIMIQKYNKKINEDGHTSPASSGASSPPWRSPVSERRRPPDMPLGVNIRSNPFLEKEVQKSASACQLSRRDQNSSEKHTEKCPVSDKYVEKVLKSQSANALHPIRLESPPPLQYAKIEDSQETIKYTTSNDTIVSDLTKMLSKSQECTKSQSLNYCRQVSATTASCSPITVTKTGSIFERSISNIESSSGNPKVSERTAKVRAARERFLSSAVPMRREGTSSTSDLRPVDMSSRVSCDSDVAESSKTESREVPLGRSASTGMVNVDQEAWQRVAEGGHRENRRSKFSLARLAAKLRRKEESGTISKLCRQSLLVQLRNKQQ